MSTIHRQRTYIINNWGILCGTFGVNHIWKKIGENKGGGEGGRTLDGTMGEKTHMARDIFGGGVSTLEDTIYSNGFERIGLKITHYEFLFGSSQ